MRSSRTSPQQRFEMAQRLELARERLAALRPAGSPANAMAVTSAAVIEPRAAALPCPHCGGQYRVLEHTRPVAPLRRLDVECRHCATLRTLWFRIVADEPN